MYFSWHIYVPTDLVNLIYNVYKAEMAVIKAAHFLETYFIVLVNIFYCVGKHFMLVNIFHCVAKHILLCW